MTHDNDAKLQFPWFIASFSRAMTRGAASGEAGCAEPLGGQLWDFWSSPCENVRTCMPRDAGSVRAYERYWPSPAKGPKLHFCPVTKLGMLRFFRTAQLQDLHLKNCRVLFRLTFSLGCLDADAPGSLVVSMRQAKARAKARRERTRPGPLIKPKRSLLRPSSSLLQVFFKSSSSLLQVFFKSSSSLLQVFFKSSSSLLFLPAPTCRQLEQNLFAKLCGCCCLWPQCSNVLNRLTKTCHSSWPSRIWTRPGFQ